MADESKAAPISCFISENQGVFIQPPQQSDPAQKLRKTRKAEAERDQLRQTLETLEWYENGYNFETHKYEPECPECEGRKPNHAPGCIVGLALGRTTK